MQQMPSEVSEREAPGDADEIGPTAKEGWLRAAVLGADDGVVSTAALLVGVAASNVSPRAMLLAGLAGLVAGAASMAAGEYVSVSSQRDLENAILGRERAVIEQYPEVAVTELAVAIQLRGIDPGLARRAAEQLSIENPIAAHARVRLGLSDENRARPLEAALASAASFAVGSSVALLGMAAPAAFQIPAIVTLALVALAICGALGAAAGGASRWRAALRVVLGGGIAMALSALIGRIVGVVV